MVLEDISGDRVGFRVTHNGSSTLSVDKVTSIHVGTLQTCSQGLSNHLFKLKVYILKDKLSIHHHIFKDSKRDSIQMKINNNVSCSYRTVKMKSEFRIVNSKNLDFFILFQIL